MRSDGKTVKEIDQKNSDGTIERRNQLQNEKESDVSLFWSRNTEISLLRRAGVKIMGN